MSISVISPSPMTSENKSREQVLAECASLIASCASSGEYINPYPADNLSAKEECEGSRLFAKYDSDDDLLGCLLMTDKDHCAEGLETKPFLLGRISEMEGISLPEDATKVFWVSSVCTSPDFRNSGCASKLFEYADKMALLQPSSYTVIAEAVRAENDMMLGFSEKKGYKRFDAPLTEEDFGVAPTLGSIPWIVLYKFLRRPE